MRMLAGTAVAKKKQVKKPSRAERTAGDALLWGRKTSAEVRDIGPPPEVKDVKLREQVEADLEAFYRIVFPQVFRWPFSASQRRTIARTQDAIENGGFSLDVEPRGTGKTQRAVRAALWAITSRRKRFANVFSATATLASTEIIQPLWLILQTRTGILHDLFGPELHGFAELGGGQNRRAKGQLCEGKPTLINMGSISIIFPEIDASKAAGSVIASWGITAAFRGQTHTLSTGDVIRPDVLFFDDPQTRESAKSNLQTDDRHTLIHGDALGLAGPDTKITCCAQCTTIIHNDLTSRLLNDGRWHGVRGQAVIKWPKNMGIWERYFQEYRRLEKARMTDRINEYYEAHRAELEEGFEVAWPERVAPGNLSPFQTIMHVRDLCGHENFEAEHQNAPIDLTAALDAPTFAGYTSKLTNRPRGEVPDWATWLVSGVDVQKRYLFYWVLAVGPGFTATTVEYGAWPEQPRTIFTRADAFPTLQSVSGSSQDTGAIVFGLNKLTEYLFGREWKTYSGEYRRMNRALVDAGDGTKEKTIFEFCRTSKFAGLLTPSYGRGRSKKQSAIATWKQRPGERLGFNWVLRPPNVGKGQSVQHVLFDSSAWKTFMAERAAAKDGEDGSLSIFGERADMHRLVEHHLAAEKAIRKSMDGEEWWYWQEKPNTENEGLDALVMAGVAAAIEGATLKEMGSRPKRMRRTHVKAQYINL